MHGYLSRDGMPPAELLATGRNEVEGYGGRDPRRHRHRAGADGRTGFWVLLADGQRISARRLLVTTGLRDELPDIPGLRDRWARDVLHCPYCHGHEVRDRRLGVIGGSPGAVRYAQIVRQWSHDVVYFTPPEVLNVTERTELLARGIGVVEGTIEQLVIDDDDELRGVQLGRRLCHPPRRAVRAAPLRAERRPAARPRLRRRGGRLGRRRCHRTNERARRLGCRQRRRPARPSHHRGRCRLHCRYRHQRRPGRRRRPQRRPRPRSRISLAPTRPPTRRSHDEQPNPHPQQGPVPSRTDHRPSTSWR